MLKHLHRHWWEAGNIPHCTHDTHPQQWEGVAHYFSTLLRNIGPFLHCMTHNATHTAFISGSFSMTGSGKDSLNSNWWWWWRRWRVDGSGIQHALWLPSATTATSRHWMGRVCLLPRELTDSSGRERRQLLPVKHHAPTCWSPPGQRWIKRKKRSMPPRAVLLQLCVCVCVRAERIHMLNATYIWYSSIASTNCPHESKSVPFLKLACHFWIVLLTSDMLAGRVLAALSEQHSRGGDSSTGLRRRRRRRRLPGYLLSEGAQIDQWHPDQALSACSPRVSIRNTSHPQYRGSPARSSGCACFGARGRPSGRQQDVGGTQLQRGNKWSGGV